MVDSRDVVTAELLPDRHVVSVDGWWQLRAGWEGVGLGGPPATAIVVKPPLARSPLPFDIERDAAAVVTVDLPGPAWLKEVLDELPGPEVTEILERVERGDNPVEAITEEVLGIAVPAQPPITISEQLRVAARLASRPDAARSADRLVGHVIEEPALRALLEQPPRTEPLRQALGAFFAGHGGTLAPAFESPAVVELGPLVTTGLLEPVTAAEPPTGWARVVAAPPGIAERAASLLDACPAVAPPDDVEGWCDVAVWWGQVRRLVARAPSLAPRAWATWEEFDEAFWPWLQQNYGLVLSSASPWPAAVHRVPTMLARRLRHGQADRVLLLVLDGLGHTQWAHIKEHTELCVEEEGSTFALVPTYTGISRQAIFAGDLPTSFASTLWQTYAERQLWERFWQAEDLVPPPAYHRADGRFPQVIPLHPTKVVGAVVNAVDDFMHTAELLGDAQMLANIDVWLEHGYLVELVNRATEMGFEVWITSDHGNLECTGLGTNAPGLEADSAGKRLVRFHNRTLRDASPFPGIDWDPIPGMPERGQPVRFAPGRGAYTRNPLSISHGGLSLDEVIVPLARVSA